MPSRNTVRLYDAPAYYHVYNRGAGGRYIFNDAQDKYKFISLLQRHLSTDPDLSSYSKYDIELTAFCVMSNHFHLLLFQGKYVLAITQLMRSVSTSYAMYFNLKYKTHGHVFQSVFKASKIQDDAYLAHITRYIHLNPETYRTYKWSSLPYYLDERADDWIEPLMLDMTSAMYNTFLEDYIDRRKVLNEIKSQLAI